MIFSKKKPPVRAVAAEKCGSCGAKSERAWKDGDCVLGQGSACKCGAKTVIEAVFGRATAP